MVHAQRVSRTIIMQGFILTAITATEDYVSPLQGSGDIVFPLASVCGSVCLSVTKLCPLYNLITDTAISTKLHTFVKHIETTCLAQEP